MYPWQGVTQRDVLWSQMDLARGLQPSPEKHQWTVTTADWWPPTLQFPISWPPWPTASQLSPLSDCNFGSFPPACRMPVTLSQLTGYGSLINCAGTRYAWFPAGPQKCSGSTISRIASAKWPNFRLWCFDVTHGARRIGCFAAASQNIIASIMSKLISTLRLIAVKWVPDRRELPEFQAPGKGFPASQNTKTDAGDIYKLPVGLRGQRNCCNLPA